MRSTHMLSESPFGFFVEKTIVKKIKQLPFCDVTIESSERGGIIMRWRKREVVSRYTIPSQLTCLVLVLFQWLSDVICT